MREINLVYTGRNEVNWGEITYLNFFYLQFDQRLHNYIKHNNYE